MEYESEVIPIVSGALGTVTKVLLKGLDDLEIRGRVETIQTTALLESARILRRVMETWKDLLLLRLRLKKQLANTGVKNLQISKIMIITLPHVTVCVLMV